MKNGFAVCDSALDVALERAAREWRDTFDAIETPILVVETDGRIARLNRAAQRLAGLGFERLVGAPLRSLGDEQPWRAAAEVASIPAEGSAPAAQVRDRAGRTWQVFANPTPAGRRIVVARDISAAVEEAHGGEARAENPSGGGARLRLRLPLAPRAARPAGVRRA